MKKSLLLLVLLPVVSLAQKKVHPCSDYKSQRNSIQKSNSFSLQQIAETEKYDVHYYHLNLNMTNTSTTLSGSSEMQAHARENLDSALLEFHPSFTITAIEVDGVPVSYNWNNTALKVPVDKTTGENFSVKVFYNGTPPTAATNPLGGGGMTNDDSPSWGNDVTWSLSEPFSAMEWFPVKQSLKDKIDSTKVWLTVPTACKGGSNGVLEQVVDLGNGTHRFEWTNNHMIDYYLISVAVAEYVEYTVVANPVGSGPVTIQNFIYNNPGTLPNFQDDIDETVDFIELFATQFGPYPFADQKYGHCMAPIGGGMEHQTMTTQGFFNPTLTAHELAHQWFGDHVTCESWADIWVNEGFASYAEYLMLAELYPGDQVTDMQDRHQDIMSQTGGSVWVEDSLNDGAIFSSRLVYNKGAAIIHTLRFLMNNDSLFFVTLKEYQTMYADSTASAMNFITVAETETGMDFSNFMEEWYYGEGFPRYSVRWNMVGNDMLVEINHNTSKPSVTPLFTNDLELRFDRTSVADTIIRFEITGNQNQFLIPNATNFVNITAIDPNNWIINGNLGIVNDPTFTVGIEEEATAENIVISPNPANGPFTITALSGEDCTYTIVDGRGKVIKEGNFAGSATIDLGAEANGMYMIQVKGKDSEFVSRKLVKL